LTNPQKNTVATGLWPVPVASRFYETNGPQGRGYSGQAERLPYNFSAKLFREKSSQWAGGRRCVEFFS